MSIAKTGGFLLRLLGSLALVGISGGLWAQSGTGTIVGTVRDTTGAVIPGVEITVRNEATNVTRTAVTNDSGVYRVSRLLPGTYEIRAELTGFRTLINSGVQLTVGETLTVDLTLEVGEISEVVTVAGLAARVQTEDSQISTLVDDRRIVDLPLNGRNVFTLALSQPGVVPTMGAVAQTGGPNSSAFISAGTRARGNNFMLDGGHNTNDGISGLPVVNPSVDAVQEFRLIRNNFSAEFGTHSGSVINVVTKSGTNSLHGSLYEFHRNDALDAADVFTEIDPTTGEKTKPTLIQNQFGATVGGPIVRDRVFFFFSYEGFRNREGSTVVQMVETPQFRDFVQKTFPNNASAKIFSQFPAQAPTSDIETVQDIVDRGGLFCRLCRDQLSLFPADLPVRGRAQAAATVRDDSDQFSTRIDVNFSEATQLYGRYTIDTGNLFDPSGFAARPQFADVNENRQQQVVLTLLHSFSPTFLNEGRFTYLYGRSDFVATNPHIADIFVQGGQAGISGTIGGFIGFPQLFTRDTFQWQDIVSVNVGNHFIRTGIDVRRAREDSDFGNTSRPAILFRGLFDFALDAPYYVQAGIDPATGKLTSTPREFRSTEVGAFIQDDWKVHPRLTLNLGLRWDYFGPTTETQNRLSNIRFPDRPTFFERVRDATVGPVDQLYEKDLNNFAPRIGFAWDVFGDHSTSLRGGYGLSYDKIFFNVGANSRFNPPFFGLAFLSNIFFGDDLTKVPIIGPDPNDIFGGYLGIPVSTPLGFDERGGVIGQILSLRVLDPNIRDSYVHSTYLGIQRALPWEMTFEINYQGTFGKKLGFIGDPNRFRGDLLGVASPLGDHEGSTRLNRINPSFASFNLRQNHITSNYHGVNTQINKRFSDGLAFQAAYTFGKSLDYNSDVFGAGGNFGGSDIFFVDPLDRRSEYGRSSADIRHRFVSSFLWEVPFMREQQGVLGQILGGWQINAIVPIQSGLPFGAINSSRFPAGDFNADGKNNDRPNVPSFGNKFSDSPSTREFIDGVFKSGDFPRPEQGTNGNLGKNTFTGPNFWTVDFSLFKNFRLPINEESRLQFRAEFFNLFNRVNLLLPQPNMDSSLFGKSTSAFDPRQIQFALKVIF